MEDCLHLCSPYLSATECATTPIGISGEITAGHLSLWRPPSQWHVTPVQHVQPLLIMPGFHSLSVSLQPVS